MIIVIMSMIWLIVIFGFFVFILILKKSIKNISRVPIDLEKNIDDLYFEIKVAEDKGDLDRANILKMRLNEAEKLKREVEQSYKEKEEVKNNSSNNKNNIIKNNNPIDYND